MTKQTRTEQLRLSTEQSARYGNESELPFSGAFAPDAGDDMNRVADLLTRSGVSEGHDPAGSRTKQT
jgi:hypothetical protein